jgi:D-alanine-D-alanine ligase
MKSDAKILICYNSPATVFSVYNGKPSDDKKSGKDLSETVFAKEVVRIKKSLKENYNQVQDYAVGGNIDELIKTISDYEPDVIFNFVESVEGVAQLEFCIASLFQLLNQEFTGNSPVTLGTCLSKTLTKNILNSMGISTPDFITVSPETEFSPENFKLNFPVILKLANEDASIGISELSVVNGIGELMSHLDFLIATYRQSVIIEEYIDGREFNVAILGDEILPISEIEFHLPPELPKIVTYEGKWIEGSIYYTSTVPNCPAPIGSRLKKALETAAMQSYKALRCRDYVRVDIRIDKNNKPYVIEVNPNPDISLDSGFVRAAAAAGISYSELLNKIAGFALARKQYDTQVKAS